MKHLNLLIDLAQAARKHIEKANKSVQLNAYLDRLPFDLAGGCGSASLHLLYMANKRGLKPTFVKGVFYHRNKGYPTNDPHCWIEYYNHAIDLTATQFIYMCEPVYITPLKKEQSSYVGSFYSKGFQESKEYISGWAHYPPELRKLA